MHTKVHTSRKDQQMDLQRSYCQRIFLFKQTQSSFSFSVCGLFVLESAKLNVFGFLDRDISFSIYIYIEKYS